MRKENIDRKKLIEIFRKANRNFLRKNGILFERRVSERTLCGALMIELNNIIQETDEYRGYYVDVEYNRNIGSKFRSLKKTCAGEKEEAITINCDLLVHSRGQNLKLDNLIALEMKKSNLSKKDKDNDKKRLMSLTMNGDYRLDDDGKKKFPENVCGYQLGIYYEINFNKQKILIQYYYNAQERCTYEIDFLGQKI